MSTIGRRSATPPDLTRVRPYGDTLDDGRVQLSFSLPVPYGDEAEEAARQIVRKMGLDEPQVYHSADLGDGYSWFIVYARCSATIDYTQIEVARIESAVMTKTEVQRYVLERLGREVVVVGACIGTDAHTVGIDAIMNMKGWNGEKGLESYEGIRAVNLGAQVACEDLVRTSRELGADALLVSQVVTQKDAHKINLTQLVDMLEAEGMRDRMILVAGGPRVGHELALEMGYDAGFGPGTTPPQVASFIVQALAERA